MGNNFCSQCGSAIEAGARFCPSCGQPSQSTPMSAAPPQQYGANVQNQSADPPGKGMALASIIVGVAGMCVPYGGIVLAIIGLVLGVVSKNKLTEGGQPTGMATAGIVIGVISLVWFFVMLMLILS